MRLTLTLLSLLISIYGKAQVLEDLYLVSGHPYDNTDEEFVTYLWRYTQNNLDTIALLSSKDDFLENMKVYPEQNLAILHKVNSIRRRHLGDNHRFLFIHYEDSIRINEAEIGIEGKISYYHSLKKNEVLLDIFTDKIQFKKISVASRKIEEATVKEFAFAKLRGIPGGAIDDDDYLLVYTNEQNGVLKIALVGDNDKRPPFPHVLPEEYQFKAYERHVVPINNFKVFVLHGNYEEAGPTLGKSDLIYLNKEDTSWHKLVIPGNIQAPRSFGYWIAGYAFNDHIEGGKLPGSEVWTQRESGLSPGERWNYFPDGEYAYAPGILYFYDIRTQEYFELETKQADSEVILIQGNTVIYRKYDELYKAPIVDGKALGKSKLLLKSDVVPDIHWAFFLQN